MHKYLNPMFLYKIPLPIMVLSEGYVEAFGSFLCIQGAVQLRLASMYPNFIPNKGRTKPNSYES